MALTVLGIQYICQNFGDTSFCCTDSGLSWYYTVGGTNYNESGGTAQVVSRLASGLVDSVTMTSPDRGSFTQSELDAANGESVTLADCQTITLHDEPSEEQWCFISCETHTDQDTCENVYNCLWYNGGCHTDLPDQPCGFDNQYDCERYGCYWWNNGCHQFGPSCEELDNSTDCGIWGCYWYNNGCHEVDQPGICYWIDDKGGINALQITNVFEIVDSYLFNQPPTDYSFTPTLQNVFGIIDYYLGFNGDANTGCTKYI